MFSAELLAEMQRFEDRWDERLGGPLSRGHREVICYVVARMLSTGVVLDDVFGYVREVVVRFGPSSRGPAS